MMVRTGQVLGSMQKKVLTFKNDEIFLGVTQKSKIFSHQTPFWDFKTWAPSLSMCCAYHCWERSWNHAKLTMNQFSK